MKTALTLSLALMGSALAVPQAVLDARKSAVQIIATLDGETHAICSGANVAYKRGHRITSAGHCVSEELSKARFTALDHAGHLWPLRLEESAFEWPRADYALFRSVAAYILPALKRSASPCTIGQDVWSWSGPLGLNLMLFGGQIQGTLGWPTEPELDAEVHGMTMTTLAADQGASGSVLVNASGEAVGILVGQFSGPTRLVGSFLAPLPQ